VREREKEKKAYLFASEEGNKKSSPPLFGYHRKKGSGKQKKKCKGVSGASHATPSASSVF